MSYGMEIKNNDNKVIVSDKTPTLHYYGKVPAGTVYNTLTSTSFQVDAQMFTSVDYSQVESLTSNSYSGWFDDVRYDVSENKALVPFTDKGSDQYLQYTAPTGYKATLGKVPTFEPSTQVQTGGPLGEIIGIQIQRLIQFSDDEINWETYTLKQGFTSSSGYNSGGITPIYDTLNYPMFTDADLGKQAKYIRVVKDTASESYNTNLNTLLPHDISNLYVRSNTAGFDGNRTSIASGKFSQFPPHTDIVWAVWYFPNSYEYVEDLWDMSVNMIDGIVNHVSDSTGVIDLYGNFNGSTQMQHSFTIPVGATPTLFIRPTAYNIFYSIISLEQTSPGNWTCILLHSGDIQVNPEIHIYLPPEYCPSSSNPYGLVVRDSEGNETFNSNLIPLNVIDGGLCIAPEDSANGWIPGKNSYCTPSTADRVGNPPVAECYINMGEGQDAHPPLDWDMNSNNQYNSYNLTKDVDYNSMFCAPSLASSSWTRKYHIYWYDDEKVGTQSHHVYKYWQTFYLAGYRLNQETNQFDAGWIPYFSAYREVRDYEGTTFGGGGGFWDSGSLPYYTDTKNRFDNAFIVTKLLN